MLKPKHFQHFASIYRSIGVLEDGKLLARTVNLREIKSNKFSDDLSHLGIEELG